MSDEVIFVETHPAEEVLPDEKIPEVEDGYPVILSDDPDKPFRMFVSKDDWIKMMAAMDEMSDNEGATD